ncbi:hypothetical protein [Streptomyces sp. NPDC005017]|uniref:hypothetical protein n=1 Tax=Streptomyces sp. NPDC005017 TaxID=3364706 RepID=UPI0036AEB182
MTAPWLKPPAEPAGPPSAHHTPPAYRPPGLLPPTGPARTWGLAVIATPVLLALTLSLLGGPTDDSAPTGSSDSGASFGSSGSGSFGPDVSDRDSRDTAAPPTGEASVTEPGWPYGDTGTTDVYGTPETTGSDGGHPFPQDTAINTPDPTPTPSASRGPGDVVTAYFDAINARDYETAWELGGRNLESSYGSFVSGYADTARDTITIESVNGPEVRLTIDALRTDGTTRSYDATYTVSGGVITSGKGVETD